MTELSPPVADFERGIVQTMEEKCNTCIFRPGNLMQLKPGRVHSMTESALTNEGHITCHKTLTWKLGAICRGFIESDMRMRSLALRAIAAGIGEEVKVNAEEEAEAVSGNVDVAEDAGCG